MEYDADILVAVGVVPRASLASESSLSPDIASASGGASQPCIEVELATGVGAGAKTECYDRATSASTRLSFSIEYYRPLSPFVSADRL